LGDDDDLYLRGLDMIEGAPVRDPSKTEVTKEEQEVWDQMGVACEGSLWQEEEQVIRLVDLSREGWECKVLRIVRGGNQPDMVSCVAILLSMITKFSTNQFSKIARILSPSLLVWVGYTQPRLLYAVDPILFDSFDEDEASLERLPLDWLWMDGRRE